MIYLRSLLFNVLIAVSLVVVGVPCLPILVLSRPTARRITRAWTHWLLWLLRHLVGLNVELRGMQHVPAGPAIFAAKHQSALETFYLTLLLPQADFVVKRELVMIPIAGWYLATLGTLPVNRGAGARALKGLLSHARASVESGRSILIFPEGTRTPLGTQQPYHPGIAALYTKLDLPVIPIALNTGLYWRRRSFAKRPGVAVIEFLEPIPPGLDRRSFMAQLKDRIDVASAQLLLKAQGNRG